MIIMIIINITISDNDNGHNDINSNKRLDAATELLQGGPLVVRPGRPVERLIT